MAATETTTEPEGGREEERSVKRNREETRAKLRPVVPDLDLDMVDQQEPRHRSQKHRKRSGKNQEEEGRSSRSLPRNRAPSWDEIEVENSPEVESSTRTRSASRNRPLAWNSAEESAWNNSEAEGRSSRSLPRIRVTSAKSEEQEISEKKRRSKRKESDLLRDNVKMKEDPKSRQISEPFSFLMPRDDQPLSDNESVASFSEVSQSAASIAWREDSDWRRADSNSPPGRWIKPSSQKLSQVLIGSRLEGQSLVGGLSL